MGKKVIITIISISVFFGFIYAGYVKISSSIKKDKLCGGFLRDQKENVMAAIESGDLDVNTGCSSPLLIRSTLFGDTIMVKWLIEKGAYVNQRYSRSYSKTQKKHHSASVLFASVNGKYDGFKRGWDDERYQVTPEYIRCLEILIEHGADLDDTSGWFGEDADSTEQHTTREIILEWDNEMLESILD